MTTAFLTAPSEKLFFTRNDINDLRWGDLGSSQTLDSENKQIQVGLWGYADDEGITLNGGRPGARFAPEFIRKFFYRLTPPAKLAPESLGDFGDWKKGPSLEDQIATISPILSRQLARFPMITLGGGHDYGAVDGAGFMQWHLQNKSAVKPLIINFDAHLDVRPWSKGLNSGTPFSWLLEKYPGQFEFIEVGIQKHCSSPQHHQWLKDQQGQILNLDYIQKVGLLTALRQLLAGTNPHQPCFISFDIDVYSQALAPGCSQSWDAGLLFTETIEALRWLMRHKQVRQFGIYEVSPPLDVDHRTSKLAACLVDEILRHWVSGSLPPR